MTIYFDFFCQLVVELVWGMVGPIRAGK